MPQPHEYLSIFKQTGELVVKGLPASTIDVVTVMTATNSNEMVPLERDLRC